MYSKKLIKIEEKELNQLLNEWDPIGILPFEGWPDDEYDCFIFPILSILHKDEGREKLIYFLNEHLTEHIGLSLNKKYVDEFADRVIFWWKNNGK